MRQLTVFQKLFLLLVFSASIPVLLLGYLSYSRSGQQIEKITSSLIMDNVANNALRLDAYFAELERFAYQVIGSRRVAGLLEGAAPADYFEKVHWISEMKSISSAINGNYELLLLPYAIDKFPDWSEMADMRGFEPHSPVFAKAVQMAGKPFWLHEVVSLERPELVYVRAIRKVDLTPIGLMAVRIPIASLVQQIMLPSQFPDFEIKLINHGRTTLSIPIGKAFEPGHLAIEPLELKYGFSTYNDGDTPYYAAVHLMRSVQWDLAAFVPVADAMGQVTDIRTYTFFVVGIVLVMLFVSLYWVANYFTRPIRRMASHMRRVEHGELRVMNLMKPRTDEIGQLIDNFNSMIQGMIMHISRISKMEQEKSRLERSFLIHQINPHFLYNTLDSVKWKAEAIGARPIANMVMTLANMLRFGLKDNEEFTRVEAELQHVTNYLNIELMRNDDAFDVIYDIQPAVLKYRMIKLIVQPLAENAVRHGMNKIKDKRGKLLITVYAEDHSLYISVEDNGPGMKRDDLELRPPQRSDQDEGGVGLYNVHRRLELHFGEAGGLEWQSGPNGGFKATIRHPIIKN